MILFCVMTVDQQFFDLIFSFLVSDRRVDLGVEGIYIPEQIQS